MDVKHLNQKFLSREVWLINLPIRFIITFGIIIRAIGYVTLPNQPSRLAPDEGTYAQLVDWIFSGKPVQDFPDYGDGLFNSAKLLILPSLGLSHLGASSLSSVRLISLLFSVLNIFLFYSLLKSIQPIEKRKTLFKLALAIYVFLPSHMIWGLLGLRESLTEFGLLVTFYFMRRIFLDQAASYFNYFYLILGLYATYNVRPQLGLVLSVVVFFSIMFKFWKSKIIVLALLFFPIANFFAGSVPLGLPQSVTTATEEYSASPEDVAAYFEDKRTGNQLFANSKIESPSCDLDLARFSSLKCELGRLPVAILQVTFRPLIFLDSGNLTQSFASLENLIWIFLYIFILLTSKKLLSEGSRDFELPATVLLFLFAIGAGLYEGNIGTAFRHKGILLPFLLLILVSRFSSLRLSDYPKVKQALKNFKVKGV
jgi:hypothetical protein